MADDTTIRFKLGGEVYEITGELTLDEACRLETEYGVDDVTQAFRLRKPRTLRGLVDIAYTRAHPHMTREAIDEYLSTVKVRFEALDEPAAEDPQKPATDAEAGDGSGNGDQGSAPSDAGPQPLDERPA